VFITFGIGKTVLEMRGRTEWFLDLMTIETDILSSQVSQNMDTNIDVAPLQNFCCCAHMCSFGVAVIAVSSESGRADNTGMRAML